MVVADLISAHRVLLVDIIELFLHSNAFLFLLYLIILVEKNLKVLLRAPFKAHFLHLLGQLSMIVVSIFSE